MLCSFRCMPSISWIRTHHRGQELCPPLWSCSSQKSVGSYTRPLPKKNKDPGCPTITCSIGTQHFTHAHCDLGAFVSIMPNVVYDKLNHHALDSTTMCLQLADRSVLYLVGIAENILVKYEISSSPLILPCSTWKSTPRLLSFWESRS